MNGKITKTVCAAAVLSVLTAEAGFPVLAADTTSEKTVLIAESFDENGADRINPQYSAERAVDGDEDTYWSVYSEAVKGSIVIDLGAAETVNSIRMTDKNAKITDYTFLYSQNLADWYELGTGDAQGKEDKLDVFPNVKARYVKICINECRDEKGNGGFDIGEIEIYYDSSVNIKSNAVGEKIYKDVNGGTTIGAAINLLSRLGIVSGDDEGYFRPNAKITRGEFAKMITNLWPENLRSHTEIPFDDVGDAQWQVEAIANVYGYGIMVGDDNSKFRPNDPITGAEACKTLITLLCNNTNVTDYIGKYPDAHFSYAATIGMLEGADVKIDSLITKKQAAKMLANILDVKLMDITGYKNGRPVYETVEETILSKYRNIYDSRGVITANEISGLDTKNSSASGTVKILDEDNFEDVYIVGDTLADELLGSRIKYYYCEDKDNGNKTLLAIDTYRTTKTELDSADIQRVENGVAEYYDGGKTKKQKFELTAPIIKNGMYAGRLAHTLTLEDLRVESGSVAFIDNNDDGTADVVIISSYTSGLVDSVSVNMNKIFLKNTTAIDFDFDNKSNRILKNGELTAAEDLKAYDVVSIMESGDGDAVTIYVSPYSPVSGAIEKYDNECITVDGTEYKLSDKINFGGVIYSKEDIGGNLKILPSVTVYLNFRQEVTGIFTENAKEQYGYLLSATYDEIEETTYLKLFNQGGKVVIHATNAKVKVDGKKITAKQTYDKLLNGTTVQKQVIRYSTDKENKVTDVILPDITAGANGKAYEGGESLIPYNAPYEFNTQRFYWKKGLSNTSTGLKEFALTDETVIMQIPTNGNEKEFRLLTKDTFKDSSEYSVMVYNVTKTGEAAFVAVSLDAAENVSHDTATYMVTKVVQTLDEYGDAVTKLTCVSQGKESSLICDEDTTVFKYKVGDNGVVNEELRDELTVSNIQPGSLIQYSGSLRASSVRLVYPKSLDSEKADTPWNFAYGWSAERVFGKVYAVDASKLAVKTGENMSYYSLPENLKFHVWDAASKTCTEGKFSDILTVENSGEDRASYFYYAPYTQSMFIFNY